MRRRLGYAGAVVAASLAIMLAGPEAMLRIRADYRTDVAARSVILPDGSRAVLDAGSAIAVHYGTTDAASKA